MRLSFLISFSYLFVLQTFGQNGESFHPPLKIPMYLSGNFGEIRSDHFHSGIDLKTQGTVGHHVFSIDSGYVSRIKVQANGYGKSIYITHPNGYTSVYGHLDRYREDIAKYVKQMQYKRRSYLIDLYLKSDQFRLMRGDFIAYSGNTGSSSGPHLHFEIRNAGNQHPTNVLKYDFDIKDQVSPRFLSLQLDPIGDPSHVNGSAEKFATSVVKNNGYYTLPYGTGIKASGILGISVEVFDYLNGASNRCAVYTLELYVDNEIVYQHVMDEFSFSETRYINAHIDYARKIQTGIKAHRLYRLPNDKLRIYNKQLMNKAAELNENKVYNMRIVATDVAGNKSELKFQVKGDQRIIAEKKLPSGYVSTFRYDKSNTFVQDSLRLEIPANALYQDMDFTLEKSPCQKGCLTQFYHVGSPHVPIQTSYTLAIKTGISDPSLKEKLLLVTLNDEDELQAVESEYRAGAVIASLRSFGKYAVSLDTIAPEIIPLNGAFTGDLSGRKSLKFTIRDDCSGIKKYEGYIDNNWVLFEYDLKNDLIFYTFDNMRITNGGDHELELYVSDAKGNVNLFHSTFTR